MKKSNLILILVLSLSLGFASAVFSEEGMPEGGEFRGQGMGPGKGGKMMGMHKDSLVATSDGGVVLMQGPRLIKYDKDMNLVKEVEIPRGKKPERPEGDENPAGSEDQAPV